MEHLNGIHIIDCKTISGKPLKEIENTIEFKDFAEQFGNGMKLNGIVYLINTGIEEAAISNFEQKLAEFYALPVDNKKLYSPEAFQLQQYGSWGWKGPTASQIAKNYTLETFDFTINPRFEDDALYPKEINGFKDAVFTFRKQTRLLSTKLLRSLGEYLDLADKDFFVHNHRANEENYALSKFSVRTLYYPKEPVLRETAAKLRLPEHQDFGTLSHICQTSKAGGLQAKLSTGEWVDVAYIPNSFVVNAGRSLEMWSGGNIPAVFHRVAWTDRSSTESRISFGCFLGPDRDTCCLPQVEENPDWRPAYTRMQPGDMFDDYFKKQAQLAEEINSIK
ncbi:flavonol synthase/flavanone 3-hydroxylase-like [Bradysia coprophila]|uniref:flavonol synthase/flavanone 3-hydroxylase-like n=1 Tax=Bradysia coprophila TaxID=38358 RepID=UPI00187DA31F|nr:flavonol synthase/flavanone 3-hydroxylase-like [Bradysia coprophila]